MKTQLVKEATNYYEADDLDKRLGAVVRRFRLLNNLTQGELAEAAGVSQAYISQIETIKRNSKIRLQTLRQISIALQFPCLSRMIEAAEGLPLNEVTPRIDQLIDRLESTTKKTKRN